MSITAKLAFPSMAGAYSAWLSEIRMRLQEFAAWTDKPAAATQVAARKSALAAQLGALMTYLGVATTADTANVVMSNSAGNKNVTGTATVVAGALTKVVAPSSAALVTSAQALTGVTPTGTYTTTVTFTVAAGVITAIVLS